VLSLKKGLPQGSSLENVVDYALSSTIFELLQKRLEILELLEIIGQREPRYICEIGGSRGGTLFLLAHVAVHNARLMSIDTNYNQSQIRAYRYLGQRRQRITSLRANSHDAATLRAVEEWLGGERLDVLFIDGDHSLRGVQSDYQMYAPLVRSGGLIAFHDIVPDYMTRYGIWTGADVGEVPVFWKALKVSCRVVSELIEAEGQDGYGIGIIEWQGGREAR